MIKKTVLSSFAFMLSLLGVVYAQDTKTFFNKADSFFSTHVRAGRVDYSAIKSDQAALQELLTLAEGIAVTPENASEYQAFWINGYNLLVIKSVVDNHPLKSPLDVGGFFDKIKHNIGGTKITLNDIENKLLRGKFPKEPRFHFVLVCAGLGCPPIISEAYLPSKLESQLEEQTTKALNDPQFIRVNKNKVKISQIFEWYTGDFTQDGKSLVDFINLYKTDKLAEKSKVSYYPYNWTLNEIK